MKIHFAISTERLRFGETMKALCGEEIPSAQPFLEALDYVINTQVGDKPKDFCSTCWRQYSAWIVAGEESIKR